MSTSTGIVSLAYVHFDEESNPRGSVKSTWLTLRLPLEFMLLFTLKMSDLWPNYHVSLFVCLFNGKGNDNSIRRHQEFAGYTN